MTLAIVTHIIQARIKPLEFAKDETNNFKQGQSSVAWELGGLRTPKWVCLKQGIL